MQPGHLSFTVLFQKGFVQMQLKPFAAFHGIMVDYDINSTDNYRKKTV